MNSFDNKYFTCGKCGEMLSLQIIDGGYLYYQCDCSDKGVITIQELIEKTKKSQNAMIPKCKTHNKDYTIYCKSCKKHFCNDCDTAAHNSHTVVSLSSLKNQISIDSLQDKIEESKEMLKELHLALKDRLVRRLKQELDKVELTYKRADIVNQSMLGYVNNLIECFQSVENFPNYHLVETMKKISFNNKEFYLDGETLFDHCNSFVKYLETSPILNSSPVPEDFKPKPTIDITKMKHVKEIPGKGKVFVLLQNGLLAIVGEYSPVIKMYNPTTFAEEGSITDNGGYFYTLSQLPGGQLVTINKESQMKIWSSTDGKKFTVEKQIDSIKGEKVISLTGDRVACCTFAGEIIIFDIRSGYKKIATFTESHLGEINSIVQLKDGRLVSGGGVNDDDVIEETVKFWDLKTYHNEPQHTVFGLICYSKNSLVDTGKGKLLVGGYHEVVVIDLKTYLKSAVLSNNDMGGVLSVCYLKDGSVLAGAHSGDDDDGGKLTQFGPDNQKFQSITVGKYTGVNAVMALNDTTIIYSSKEECVICSQ